MSVTWNNGSFGPVIVINITTHRLTPHQHTPHLRPSPHIIITPCIITNYHNIILYVISHHTITPPPTTTTTSSYYTSSVITTHCHTCRCCCPV